MGFDPQRPQVGICVEFRSPEMKKLLIEHNKRFACGNNLLPNIEEDKVLYGSLAGSHLNLALRLIQQGAFSPVGDLRSLGASDKNLEEVVHHGHKWYVLNEDTNAKEQVEISLWRNQDQNENHGTHKVELIQTIMSTAKDMSASDASTSSRGKLKTQLGDLVAKAQRRTPAKVSFTTMAWLTKFFVQFLEDESLHLVHELVDFHSAKVNPRNLVVSTAFFQFLVTEEGLKKTPLLRHYLLLTQYTEEKTKPQAAGPSFAQFPEPPSILHVAKKADLVQELEAILRDARKRYLPRLEASTTAAQASLDLAVLGDGLIRCIMAKPWPEVLKPFLTKQAVGRCSVEKVKVLKIVWASWDPLERSPD